MLCDVREMTESWFKKTNNRESQVGWDQVPGSASCQHVTVVTNIPSIQYMATDPVRWNCKEFTTYRWRNLETRRSQIFRNEFRRRDWHRQDTPDLLCKKLWKQDKTFKKTQVRVIVKSQTQMCKTAIERENFHCYCVSTSQTSKGFKRICDMDNYILFEK